MLEVLLVGGLLVVARFSYLAATLFMTCNVKRWVDGLLPVERGLVRWWASRGLTEADKQAVRRMRERMSRGLPPY